MKTIKYIPREARMGEEIKFEGYVELRPPLFEERLQYMQEFGLQVNEDGNVNLDESDKRMTFLIRMIKASRAHYVTINIKNLATGEVHTDYESLSADPDCGSMMSEIGSLLVNGLRVGNG